MELKQFFYMIRKRILLILSVPILVSVITAAVSILVMKPVYEASSTLYIVSQNSSPIEKLVSYEQVLANEHLVKDYRELMKSKLITKAVIKELNITDITSAALSENISVTSKNDTRVLEIKVKDKDSLRAKELADTICKVFIEKSKEIMKVNNISVVDTAEVQKNPVSPKPFLYIVLSFFTSILATIGACYLFELISETIKTSEDVETYLGLNILGTIPSFNIK